VYSPRKLDYAAPPKSIVVAMRRHADKAVPAHALSRARRHRGLAPLIAFGVFTFAVGLALSGCSRAQVPPPDYNLVFEDEFADTALDTTVWATEMRWGAKTDDELQTYVPEAHRVNDGRLSITASETPEAERPYSSGTIASFDGYSFTYGYVEIRARVPEGRGLWPAFWLAPVDTDINEEIDILEVLGQEPDRLYMALHYDDAQGVHREPQTDWQGPDFSEDFHTFAVDWSPETVIWYVDGVERSRQTVGVPSDPMYLIANLAIGGEWAGWPDPDTQFPAVYAIDYIRVYQSQ
jgi:beta-glucanase (GH16 family)